jgi:hypothetical protein
MKTAIDENGNVIAGGDVVKIKDLMDQYDGTILDDLLLGNTPANPKNDPNTNGKKMVDYLKGKIGVASNGRVQSGFCRPVLDKCRQYTYSNGTYVDNNTIVKSYLERTMAQIRAAQNGVIAEYAAKCVSDVSACYNSQVTQINSYASGLTLSPSSVKPILMGACRNIALSCANAVFSSPADRAAGGKCDDPENCINNLSEMFYQAMLCTISNSKWNATVGTPNDHLYVNSNCQCNIDYYPSLGACARCPENSRWMGNDPANVNYTLNGLRLNATLGKTDHVENCPAGSVSNPSGTGPGSCLPIGQNDGDYVNNACKCNAGFKPSNGLCVLATIPNP